MFCQQSRVHEPFATLLAARPLLVVMNIVNVVLERLVLDQFVAYRALSGDVNSVVMLI